MKRNSLGAIIDRVHSTNSLAELKTTICGADIEPVLRRVEEVRSMDERFGGVELSPFMQSILQLRSA